MVYELYLNKTVKYKKVVTKRELPGPWGMRWATHPAHHGWCWRWESEPWFLVLPDSSWWAQMEVPWEPWPEWGGTPDTECKFGLKCPSFHPVVPWRVGCRDLNTMGLIPVLSWPQGHSEQVMSPFCSSVSSHLNARNSPSLRGQCAFRTVPFWAAKPDPPEGVASGEGHPPAHPSGPRAGVWCPRVHPVSPESPGKMKRGPRGASCSLLAVSQMPSFSLFLPKKDP